MILKAQCINVYITWPLAYWHASGPESQGSIPGWVIPWTQKIVLDASWLNTQHYKVLINGKWSNPGKGVAPSLHLSVVAIEKGAFGLSSTMLGQLVYIYIYIYIYI